MDIYSSFRPLESRRANETGLIDDNNFGPFYKVPGKTTFDFTLLFEETILSIPPSILLLILIPPRLCYLWKSPRKVTTSHLLTTKIVLLAIFSILQLVNVIEISKSPLQTRVSLVAALLVLMSTLGLCILSYFEHSKNIRPSSIINAYLLLTLPFDAAQLRTRWLRGHDVAGNGVASSILGLKLLILISEAMEKKSILFAPYKYFSPEATSGLFSRGLFWWLTPLFGLGFRGTVHDGDLFKADEDLLSEACEARFLKHWRNRTTYHKKHTLVWVILRAMIGPLSASIPPRLALIFFRFMQPLLISKITSLINSPSSSSEFTSSKGWALTAASGLIYISLALTTAASQHKTNRSIAMIRGALIAAIYTQTLSLPINLDESAAVTLMSSDVERICVALQPIHDLWASPLEIALAIWLLQKEIGIALLGPLFITIIAVSGPFFMAKYMGNAQKVWMERIQTRIDTTAKMLQSMKGIKMLGLSEQLSSIISQLRMDEITHSLKMRKLFVVMIAFGNMSDIFAPVAAFLIYVIVASVNGEILDGSSAFTALALIALLVAPIRAIVFAVPPLIAAVGCFDRIEKFIAGDTKRDHRMVLSQVQGHASGIHQPDLALKSMAIGPDIELEHITSLAHPRESPTSITLKNLTLGWSTPSTPILTDISLSFSSKSLTMIIGPIGSGKSSLLKGLLGETPISKGNIYINRSHIAFADQTPWIQNRSIRENIIGPSSYESVWYQKVIHACALDTDIKGMVEGDGTIAGSGGAALSGGQRLRIALARAVYSRHPILILDDVFSGLDTISKERIFTRLLGKTGLLRQLGITTILATHAAHSLSYADHIVVLSEGTIAEQGTFQELIANNGYVSNLATRNIVEKDVGKEPELVIKVDDDSERRNAEADIHRPIGDWATYRYYFESLGWKSTGIWMCLMVFYSLLLQFPNLWIKFWTSAIAIHGNSLNGFYLGILISISILTILTLVLLATLLLLKMIPHSASFFHTNLLKTIIIAPLFFLTKTDTGTLINRFSHDLSVLDSELPVAFLILANNIFTSLIQAILICISASYFVIAIPFLAGVMYALQNFYLRTSRQLRLMDLSAKAPLHTHFLETLSGLVTIRAFGWNTSMQQQNTNLLDISQKPFYLLSCIQVWLMLVIDLLVAALAVILVALVVKLRYTANAGFVGLALLNLMKFNMTLSTVIVHWTATETSLGAVERIKSFVSTTPSENVIEDEGNVPENWPTRGAIEIKGVEASYSLDQEIVLRDLNINIEAGQKIGICGPSGAGKSSFIALLLNMLEITKGNITIDSLDITTIPLQTLRSQIIVLPQESVFIKGSIRQNLDPFHLHKSDDLLLHTLTTLNLLELVMNIEKGLDSQLEPANLLSHGQRQLFCLARAVLQYKYISNSTQTQIQTPRKTILILDEPTANVDLETENLMQRIIGEEFKECTTISIAHRLSTIINYDKIAVFNEGRIVEYGEPGELLEREEGVFRGLWGEG